MRNLMIAAPWITASAAAAYAISQWNRLPERMAVTFFMGRVTGWQAKAAFIPIVLLLMFGSLALLTILLSMPAKIRVREGPLSDPVEDRRRRARGLFVAHDLICGLVLPLTLTHVVSVNLG